MVRTWRSHLGCPSALLFLSSVNPADNLDLICSSPRRSLPHCGHCQLPSCRDPPPPRWNLNMTLNILVTQFKAGTRLRESAFDNYSQAKTGSGFLILYMSEGKRDGSLLLWFRWPILNAWWGYEIHYHYLDLIKPNRSISTY